MNVEIVTTKPQKGRVFLRVDFGWHPYPLTNRRAQLAAQKIRAHVEIPMKVQIRRRTARNAFVALYVWPKNARDVERLQKIVNRAATAATRSLKENPVAY